MPNANFTATSTFYLHEAKPRLIVTFGGEIEANRHFWSRRFARLIGILIEAIVRLALCKSEASRGTLTLRRSLARSLCFVMRNVCHF